MKYTAQMILKDLRYNHQVVMEHFKVDLKDRKYQIWQSNPLCIELRKRQVFEQKLEYIHSNPEMAGLCQLAEDYLYSSASFYEKQDNKWKFITHYGGE